MQRIIIPLTIDRRFIFRHISQEQIFERYLGLPIDEDEFYTNPLRNDKHGDCKYWYQNNGRLWFIDFAGRSYDCFNVVEIQQGVNYYDACRIIARDFGLLDGDIKVKQSIQETIISEKIEKIPVTLRVDPKKYFSASHLGYWKQFNLPISDQQLINDLYVAGIRPINFAWLQRNEHLQLIYSYSTINIGFVYDLNDGQDYSYEFYFPFNKKGMKHLHSSNDVLHDFNQLPKEGKFVVITKSKKDAFLLRYFGIPSCAVMTERKLVPERFMVDLQGRFDYMFTLFDSDMTGIQLSQKMRKTYNTIPLFFTRNMKKDFSDNLIAMGYTKMFNLVESLNHKLN